MDLLCGDMRALCHDRGFHQQDEKGERHPNRGEDEKRVEIGECGGLLLAKILRDCKVIRLAGAGSPVRWRKPGWACAM